MAQQEVYNFLKKNPRLESWEIAEKLQIGRSSISVNLRRLVNSGEVKRICIAMSPHPRYIYETNENNR